MDKSELLKKYGSGQLTKVEEKQLEKGLASGEITLDDLDDLTRLRYAMEQIPLPDPSDRMTTAFYEKLAAAKRHQNAARQNWWRELWVCHPVIRWAYSFLLIGLGLGAGLLISQKNHADDRLENLTTEVSQMKEMMMLTLLEKESPSDRLKAVSLTNEMPTVSNQVTEALFKTLNNDPNVNVRLAALEALFPYASLSEVREGLIRSISQQDSPLVQVALAEMMVTLHEKRSVSKLKAIAGDANTPPDVRERIEKSIQVLI